MPSYKSLTHLHPPLPCPLHLLEEDNAVLTHTFSPCAKATHRKNPNRLSEAFACDDFRMYDYKVRRCMRGRSHDWTDCPFAHPGEKARRRDPRKIHYSGEPCPDFRKGSCRRGDACQYAHGVFECWLHPARYRTQPCKDGKDCTRKVCFFAHSMQQLRHVAAPVEESLAEEAPMDSHVHELYSHTHELGSPVGMGLSEDSFKERVAMVDSYEHEVGLALQTNSSALSPGDVYANVGSISDTLSMLALSCENSSGSPFEAIAPMGFSSNNAMGIPLEVHSQSPNFSTVAPRLPSSGMGAISKNDPSMFERSIAPAIFSSASSLQPYNTPVVEGLSSSNSHTTSEPLSYVGGSQAAARQTFLMCERGESIFNASAHEVSDMVHYGGYGDMAMLHGFMNATRRGWPDTNEVANELSGTSKLMGLTHQQALLRKEMHEFSSYNCCGIYGLSSPTSTLAGPLYLSPFSSPPLSPLSTPSSETINVFSSSGHGNVQVDDRSFKADAHLQKLKLKHIFTDQHTLHSNHHSRLLGYGALPQSPLFSQCTSGQNKWITSCKNWNPEGTGVSQLTADGLRQEICDRFGEEGVAENAMPDLGWVHELVM